MALSLKDLNKFRPAPKRGEGDGGRPPTRRVKPWEDLPPEAEEQVHHAAPISKRADAVDDAAFQPALGGLDREVSQSEGSIAKVEPRLSEREVVAERGGAVKPALRASAGAATFETLSSVDRERAQVPSVASAIETEALLGEFEVVDAGSATNWAGDVVAQQMSQSGVGFVQHNDLTMLRGAAQPGAVEDGSIESDTQAGQRRQKRNKGPLPTSPQQMLALGHLIALQISTGIGHTPLLKRAELAKLIGLKDESAKKQVQRLVDSGYVLRREARDGRGTGGTIYEVPRDVLRAFDALNRFRHVSERPGVAGIERDQVPWQGVPSEPPTTACSPIALPSVVDDRSKLLSQQLQVAAERFGLAELGIGANDLMNVWRAGAFSTEEHLISSLEHLAFYLGTEHAKGIKHPKAWVIAQLKRGYYAPPAGFQSLQERQEEAALQAAQAKLERLRELERNKLEAEFELWLAELTDERWCELLHGTPWASRRVVSAPVKGVLRPVFMEERARLLDA